MKKTAFAYLLGTFLFMVISAPVEATSKRYGDCDALNNPLEELVVALYGVGLSYEATHSLDLYNAAANIYAAYFQAKDEFNTYNTLLSNAYSNYVTAQSSSMTILEPLPYFSEVTLNINSIQSTCLDGALDIYNGTYAIGRTEFFLIDRDAFVRALDLTPDAIGSPSALGGSEYFAWYTLFYTLYAYQDLLGLQNEKATELNDFLNLLRNGVAPTTIPYIKY